MQDVQEVLNSSKELYSLLETKMKTTEVLHKQLAAKKAELEDLKLKATAKLNRVSAMERIYQKYVDFDKEVRKFNATKVDYTAKIKAAQEQEDNDKKVLEKIAEEQKKLDATKAMLSKQAIAFKEQKADFDRKKIELKGMLTGEAVKGMLK